MLKSKSLKTKGAPYFNSIGANVIYADNAATTRLDIDALHAMLPWLQEEFGNPSQPYSFAQAPRKVISDSRELIASCIGANADEIYFTSGGTESDNWAILGTLDNAKAHIITSKIEHHAILNTCKYLEDCGANITYLDVDSTGIVLPKMLLNQISHKTNLVSIMFANNEIGTIEPISELASIAHENHSIFHTDAVQAVGHVPINVNSLNVDLLSASAHKFNGPKGIGFLYIRRGIKIKPIVHGGKQERRMRAGTENVAAIVGMATALKKNCDNLFAISQNLRTIKDIFLNTLERNKVDFICNGDPLGIPGNTSISVRGISGETLLHRLDLKKIAISTGSACDSGSTQISHVIKAIGVPNEYAEGTVRISFGSNNTIDDAIKIAEAIVDVLRKRN